MKIKSTKQKLKSNGIKKKVKKVKSKSKSEKTEYGSMSVDEFFNKYDQSDSEVDEKIDENESDIEEQEDLSDTDEAEKHKRDLEKLKESDPEFYKFLQENDKKLLHFNLSDEDDDDDDSKDKKEETDSVHIPTDELAVASDESDFEDEDDKPTSSRVITLKMLKTWQKDIQTDKSNKTIVTLTQAFHAALMRVSNPDEETDEITHFKVDGSSVFNSVIQICVLELGPAIKRFLGLKSSSKIQPHKCKKFNKIKNALKCYFTDLSKILSAVTSSNIQTVLLKHLHYMSSLLTSFPHITKSIIKHLVVLWSTADETVRVIAFFCILRITNNQQTSLLDTVLKSMYMQYVKNSKFLSVNSLASVNFMRRSLVELYTLDVNVTYQHVFLYIRQLAIHLRNAITLKKKENLQSVYNWQFVNSLRLWGNLLSVTCNKPQLQQLVYPFVQVCLGTIKLIPTTQYYPLRFHIVQILIDLSKDIDVFIPVLPFLLEVLTAYDFNRKHQKVSMKPLHFTCLLRLSKSQLQENGFKDRVIETIFGQLLEYLSYQSSSIAFPDLSLICSIHLKQFNKTCRNVNYTRKMKQILEKIEQNNQFIEKEREKLTLNITDFKQINGWETLIRNNGTPLTEFYENWKKLHTIKKNKELTNNEELGDYKLPKLKKFAEKVKKTNNEPVELFPSDDDESDDEKSSKLNEDKPKRGKRGGKNARKVAKIDTSGPVDDGGVQDVVEDIEINDW